MRKIILLIVVLAVIAVGWFLYFNNGDNTTIVSLSEAECMDLGNSLEFSGVIVPKHMYSVMSETGGTVEAIHVSEGGSVKAGDSLFDLEASQAESLLREAQLNYDMLLDSQLQTVMNVSGGMMEQKAKVALALSQATGYDYESFNNAFSDQLADNAATMAASLSDMDMEDVTGVDMGSGTLDDQVALAELTVERLKDQIESMSYKSLLKGTVIAVNINEGEVLSPGIPAMIIANTDNILIEGYVYEKDLASLEKSMDVRISTEGGSYDGKVTNIGKAAADIKEQSNFGTMTKVEVTPDSEFSKIPGAEVDLEIVLSEKKDVLALPLECITEDGYVYVVGEDDVLEKRAVETGFKDTFYFEIISGLVAGEKVVLTPENVKEGQRVTYDRS